MMKLSRQQREKTAPGRVAAKGIFAASLILFLTLGLSGCLWVVEEQENTENPTETPMEDPDGNDNGNSGWEMPEDAEEYAPSELREDPVDIGQPVETDSASENSDLTSPEEPVELTEVDGDFPDSVDALDENSLTSEAVIGYFEEKYGEYGGSFIIQVSVGPNTFEADGMLHHQKEVYYTLTRKEDDQVLGREVYTQVYRQVALNPPIEESLEGEYRRVVEEDRIADEIEQEIVARLNETREENGLSTVTLATDLTELARIKSMDMGLYDYFSHTSPTYGSPFEMARGLGVRLRSENIQWATWSLSADEVHENFMDSPGHRDNRMTDGHSEVGIGVIRLESGYFVTELFR